MKKIIISWVIRIAILAALVGGLYMAHIRIVALKHTQADVIARLEQLPKLEIELTNQQTDFDKREFDIKRIETLLTDRADIPQVVASIEQEGVRYGVKVTIPAITEMQRVDADGNVLPPTGPTQDIGIKISVEGDPHNVITFVHAVEHLPYLMYVDSFTMKYEPPEPSSSKLPDGIIPKPLGLAQVNIVLAVRGNQK